MALKWFDPRKKSEKVTVPQVSFGKYHMRLNNLALSMFRTKPEYVLLGFDEESKQIAIMTCGEDEAKKLKVSYNDKQNALLIRLKGFANSFKISEAMLAVGKVTPRMDKDMMIIDLIPR